MPGLFSDFTQTPGQEGPLTNFFMRMNPGSPFAQATIGQRMMNQEYNAYQGMGMNPQQALIAVMHPELVGQMSKPMDVQPGGSVWSGFNPFSLGAGQTGGGSVPQGAPGSQPAAPGGPSSGIQYTNTNGMIDDVSARRAAEQYVRGDASALGTGGMGALGQVNKAKIQNMITQVMGEWGLNTNDVLQNQSRFPAVKKAVDKLYSAQASMGQAGIEFQQLWPQFVKDLQTYGATQYPDANKFFQWLDSKKGDPNVAPLQQRMLTLSNVYGRAVSQNPASANTDLKHREFGEALNQFWPLAATGRIGDAMNQEIQTAHDSVGKEVNRLFVDAGIGKKPDAATMQQYQAAIDAGKPKDKLIERLHENGYVTSGF